MTILIDGTSGITYPQGATQIVGAGPAFSAYASATQTVTSATLTKVAINTEHFDTNSNFDTTNYRFTPTVEGYYQVNGNIRAQASTTMTNFTVLIYKNGTGYKRSQLNTSFTANSGQVIQVADVIYMNGSTDYLELYGQINGTGTLQFDFVSSAVTSYFSACLIRGA